MSWLLGVLLGIICLIVGWLIVMGYVLHAFYQLTESSPSLESEMEQTKGMRNKEWR
jgi:hypothetical protein